MSNANPPPAEQAAHSSDTFAPLRLPAFRRIWSASFFCNAGQQIQAVAAAWALVQLSAPADQVALVQTASMLPVMLLALPSGALADIFDRRKAAILALCLALSGALLLAVMSFLNALNTGLILLSCFVVGVGMTFFTPAWQASVIELVGAKALPAGVALNAVSNNLARSVGPTLAGLAVIAFGSTITYGLNVLLYLPMLVVLFLWKRPTVKSKLPPEQLGRASLSGLRYAAFSPPMRRVMFRSFVSGLGTSAIYGLLPLIAKVKLGGDAGTYGMLLGAFGFGAVCASLLANWTRTRFTPESSLRTFSATQGAAVMLLAFSPYVWLSAIALFVTGACWVINNATFNISIQMSAPRWVAGRLLAIFYAAVAGGLSLGSWLWGHLANLAGIDYAMMVAGVLLLASPLLGLIMALPAHAQTNALSIPASSLPEVNIDMNGQSGPIVLEVTYLIPIERSYEFHTLMQDILQVRGRNGAYGMSLSRDVTDPLLWKERVQYPTWHDYVRARDRPTQAERDLQTRVNALHEGPEPIRVRRLLERPFGSLPRQDQANSQPSPAVFRSAADPG